STSAGWRRRSSTSPRSGRRAESAGLRGPPRGRAPAWRGRGPAGWGGRGAPRPRAGRAPPGGGPPPSLPPGAHGGGGGGGGRGRLRAGGQYRGGAGRGGRIVGALAAAEGVGFYAAMGGRLIGRCAYPDEDGMALDGVVFGWLLQSKRQDGRRDG